MIRSRRHFVQHRLKLHAVFVSAAVLGPVLAGCGPKEAPRDGLTLVKTLKVEFADYAPRITFTGEVRARAQSDLSFRVAGRVIERNVDVGSHVDAGQILARIDPKEQDSDVAAAAATVQAAEAQLRVASSKFDRQKTLLAQGFTTRREYDQAEQAFRVAQGSLDSARAQLGATRDQRSQTTLTAPASGVITARSMETGQVVQPAQAMFTLAQDGPRDAVFNVHESMVGRNGVDNAVEITLASDPTVKTLGELREVAPAIDPATGTVRVKIGLADAPPAMVLGSAVIATAHVKPRKMAVLPWSALFSEKGKPAVWIVEPQAMTVSLRRIEIESYRTGEAVVSGGLQQGDVVVTAGAQFLRPSQKIAFSEGPGQ
jgi:membrane fusion protein, multidrug efflux system